MRRAVLLAALLQRRRGICVAGMHGKTTTTSLLVFALEQMGARPSYAIGALVPQLTPHARFVECGATVLPNSSTSKNPENRLCISSEEDSDESGVPRAPHSQDLFVVETDESDGTLREFLPEHAIILNVDAEHLDYYSNFEAIGREFQQRISEPEKPGAGARQPPDLRSIVSIVEEAEFLPLFTGCFVCRVARHDWSGPGLSG